MRIVKGFARAALLAGLLLGSGGLLSSAARDPRPESCADIEDDEKRLACFDAIPLDSRPPDRGTFLERHWDLHGESRLFQPWPHRPNYILPLRWTDNPNNAPFDEAAEGVEERGLDIQPVEVKFQVSFKTKVVRGLFGGPGDVWFGYTQQSHFQFYNAGESRPFRETNYQPEFVMSFPLRRTWGQWTWRMIGAGILHESNGRSEPLSRSWNRVYAVAAVERGDVSIHIRPWIRIEPHASEDDDNPDIEEHVGRLEAVVQWLPGRHALVIHGRSSLDVHGHKGSFRIDWFFPIGRRIRGQVQAFTGYGESLIDYDHRQTTVGAGVLLFDPF